MNKDFKFSYKQKTWEYAINQQVTLKRMIENTSSELILLRAQTKLTDLENKYPKLKSNC